MILNDKIKDFKNKQAGAYGKQNIYLYLILFFIVGGYIFFFTSNFTLPQTGDLHFSKLNEENSINGGNVIISRWDYCKNEKKMEVELLIERTDYISQVEYSFSATCRPNGLPNIVEIVNEQDYVIIQLENIPKDFTEISLKMNIKETVASDVTESELKLYSNYKQINTVDNIETLTKNQYLINKLKRTLKTYNEKITEFENNISALQEQIETYNKQISELEEKKIYQTEKELENTNGYIEDLQSQIIDLKNSISDENQNIIEYKNKIAKAELQLSDLQNGVLE